MSMQPDSQEPLQVRKSVVQAVDRWRQRQQAAENGQPASPSTNGKTSAGIVDVPYNPQPVRGAVADGVGRWRQQQEEAEEDGLREEHTDYPAAETILHGLPRREQLIDPSQGQQAVVPVYEPLTFETSWWQSVGRLLTWINLLLSVLLGTLFDRLRGRDSVQRQAVRLREGLERAGGTFVKLGQQLAMRIDLLPWDYSIELSKMLDKMVPFPVEEALAAVERTTGRPWDEVFAIFDPQPIGSASMACVYQAVLKDGSKVAVKVRRPGIGELFMADFRVLDWITDLAEFLTFVRPGFTKNLRVELRETLLEELDFRREGRFQDTFRRKAPESGKSFFTAPRVFFDLSSEEVLVQEFVSGVWLWEVIAAVEQKDPKGRQMLRRLNIDPNLVGRRILWAAFWSMDENLFFHADPHPANILVRENNQLTFIDFGSCGSFNKTQKIALEQIVLSMQAKDAEGMARASLGLLEPLPPVDLPALLKEAQSEYMGLLHIFNTPAKYTEWWERTSARQWLALISVSRKFNLPMNLHMLRMIRATLLYDTIVLRLDHTVDRYYEYTLFMKDRAQLVKKQWRSRIRDNAGDGFFLRLEELAEAANDLMLQAQSSMGRPIVRFGPTVDKWIFTASVLSRMAGRIIIVTVLAMAIVDIMRFGANQPVTFAIVLGTVVNNVFYQLFILGAVVLNIRHILFRLRDRESGGQ